MIAFLSLVLGVGSASAKGVVDFFGGAGVLGGQFSSSNEGPGGVAVNQAGAGGAMAGDLYVVDRGNHRVQQLSATGAFVRAFGFNVGGPGVHVCTVAASCVAGTASAEAAGLSNPQGIAIDQVTGNLYVTDQVNRRVDVFSATGAFQGAFGWGVDTGAAEFQFCTAASTCQAPAAAGPSAGQFGAAIGYPAVAPLALPTRATSTSPARPTAVSISSSQTLTGEVVTGMSFVKGWGWGVDTGAAEFQQCTTASVCQAPNTSFPTVNPGQFSFNQPQGLAVDGGGNVYAVESAGNNRAQKFDSSGNTAALSATQLSGSPGSADIAINPASGRLYGLKGCDAVLCAGAPVPAERRVFELNSGGVLFETHAQNAGVTRPRVSPSHRAAATSTSAPRPPSTRLLRQANPSPVSSCWARSCRRAQRSKPQARSPPTPPSSKAKSTRTASTPTTASSCPLTKAPPGSRCRRATSTSARAKPRSRSPRKSPVSQVAAAIRAALSFAAADPAAAQVCSQRGAGRR